MKIVKELRASLDVVLIAVILLDILLGNECLRFARLQQVYNWEMNASILHVLSGCLCRLLLSERLCFSCNF